jgi:NAD(P)-dependent dehydrogenase (short-subunit alcohol dehydrogenase family)
VPFPALDGCRTVAVLGGGAALDLPLAAAPADTADVLVLLHGLGSDAAASAFAALTPLAARATHPRLLVGVAADTVDGAAFTGVIRTAAVEWGSAWKCVTITGPSNVAAVAAELAHGGGDREVRLGSVREVRTRVLATIAGDERALPDGPWIVSGGARGVTAECVIALARAGARKIVLLGRTPLADDPACCANAADEAALKRALIADSGGAPDLKAIGRRAGAILAAREVRRTLAAIAAAGGEARYVAVDVADRDHTARAVAEIRQAWGPIRGLVHAAGVLADKRIGDKTAAQFATVMRTKLDGARALLAACAADPLDVLCFFSSVAAHAGNAGQSDYAAANAALERIAADEQARRGSGCHVVSIAWGPWAGGMVTESLARHFTARGVSLIPLRDGAEAFVRDLRGGRATQVIVGCGLDDVHEDAPARIRVGTHMLPALVDHRIAGAVVLPMAIALDRLVGEGRRVLGADCEARDLRLLQGVVFDEREPDAELAVDVDRVNPHGVVASLLHRSGRPAYRVDIARTNGDAPPMAQAMFRAPSVPDACRNPYDRALFHGPAFRVIREVITCETDAIAARIATAAGSGWTGTWQFDPAVVDGAVQLVLLWSYVHHGLATLPTGIARCRAWRALPHGSDVGCIVTCRREDHFRITGDARIVDLESGAPLLSLDGIAVHALDASSRGPGQ